MKKFCVQAAFALVIGAVLSAQATSSSQTGPQGGPDLSGRWTRESASGSANSSGWGPQVEIVQSGVNVTVQPVSGKPARYRLDGAETAEVVSVDGCKNVTRITQARTDRGSVTITTWLVTKSACIHGEVDDEPIVFQTGAVELRQVRGGPRRLESITVVFRDGNSLNVETTRATPGGAPTSTTTTYRK